MGIGSIDMKLFFENCFLISLPEQKWLKRYFCRQNVMFNIWQTNFLLKYSSMFCYYDKPLLTVLGLVLYKLHSNEKCQVSLVIKYRNYMYTIKFLNIWKPINFTVKALKFKQKDSTMVSYL